MLELGIVQMDSKKGELYQREEVFPQVRYPQTEFHPVSQWLTFVKAVYRVLFSVEIEYRLFIVSSL